MSDMQVIRSRENPHAKQLDTLLRQKKAREASGMFVLEGARLCLDALSAGLRPESVLLTPAALRKNPELAALVQEAPQTIWLDETLAERLGDTKTPQGVFAVLKMPEPATVKIHGQGRYLLLHKVRDPGNLGGILRTAAALGVSAVFLCDCAELYSPKVLRASMGGIFRLPVVIVDDMAAQIQTLRQSSVETYAAALRPGARSTDCLSGDGAKAILIGNEGTGLPDELITACNDCVAIPMKSGSESLNAAMAAGILMWEMLRN